MYAIETENLKKFYGASRGIDGIDLAVAEGDFFGFIGPNGAGKSTTIRILTSLISPTGGSAKIFGFDCASMREKTLSHIGYVPSEATFYSGMTAGEMISFSQRLRGTDCSREAAKLCERFEVDAKKKVEDMSLGNRKKVSIVCAFQHSPRLLLLDEATGGLDPLMQKEFFSLLDERMKDGATVFMSSHVLSEIQRHCKNAAIIREGKIIACDKVENLSKTSARRVILHGIDKAPALPGVAALDEKDGIVSFLYSGGMKSLISALDGLDITDMTVSEPDIEEIFLHYYAQ